MARAQLFIEGFAAAELKALARVTSLLPLFSGKPVSVSYGRSTLLGGVKKLKGRLIIEVTALRPGAQKLLKALRALTREIAALRGVRTVEWRLPDRRRNVERVDGTPARRTRASAPRLRTGRRRASPSSR